MQVIELTTEIRAPIARCFELSLNIDLETEAGRPYGLRAIEGRTSGMIGAGEQVTWRAKQFGFWVTHTSVISNYREPEFFEDTMIQGAFSFFCHQHSFRSIWDECTAAMHDHLMFAMPFGPIRSLLETTLIRKRVVALLHARNALIKKMAEAV